MPENFFEKTHMNNRELAMSTPEQRAEMERMAAAMEASGLYRVLRFFDSSSLPRLPGRYALPPGAGIGVVLDTETTGKVPGQDKIVELGLVTFGYDLETGAILGVLEVYDGLEDPGMPISAEASAVNGITDEMVAGQAIDDETVERLMTGVDFVLAHNARFDRGFCEERFPVFKNVKWACSHKQVDWSAYGIASSKLEYIASMQGFFYEAHRADNDCLALLRVLELGLPGLDTGTLLGEILANANKEERRIWAVAAPFEMKDALKARNYSWSDGTQPDTEKAWSKVVPLDEYEAELAWLKEQVFRNRSFSVPVDRISAFNRFTNRRERLERAYC